MKLTYLFEAKPGAGHHRLRVVLMICLRVPIAFIVALPIDEVVFVHGVVRVVLLLIHVIIYTILVVQLLKALCTLDFSACLMSVSMIFVLLQKVVVIFVIFEFFSHTLLHPIMLKLDFLLVFVLRWLPLILPVGIVALILEFT